MAALSVKRKYLIVLLAVTFVAVAVTAAATGMYGLLPGKKNGHVVACVGDSLTYGFGTAHPAAESYPGYLARMPGKINLNTENYGVSGATVDDDGTNPFAPAYTGTERYRDSLNTKADIILIMLGTNDAFWSAGNADFTGDFKKLLEAYIALPHAPKVIVMTPPRLPGLEGYDEPLAEIAAKELEAAAELELDTIDIYTFSGEISAYSNDGVHFTAEGNARIAEFIYSELARLLSE